MRASRPRHSRGDLLRVVAVSTALLAVGGCGSGSIEDADAFSDADEVRRGCPDDGDPCTLEVRQGWRCSTRPAADGAPCPGGTCAAGRCVESSSPADAGGAVPDAGTDAPDASSPGCVTATAGGPVWAGESVPAQAARFEIEWTVTPGAAGLDTGVGLSLGAPGTWQELATIVRFNASGAIDVCDGRSSRSPPYEALTALPFAANQTYRIRQVVDVPLKRYSVYVTPAGDSEVTLAQDFAFRAEQQSVASLDHWGVMMPDVGSASACFVALRPLACTAETDAQFCARLGAQCGALSGRDNCGANRSVADCGACTAPKTCGGAGQPNQCGAVPSTSGIVIGPRPVAETPLAEGTLFVANNGSGTACTLASPCALVTAIARARGGDVVFLRGGVYPVSARVRFNTSGSAAARIVYESYPGELAIFDGSSLSEGQQGMLTLYGNFIALRRLEVRNMPEKGIYIGGNDSLVEGVHAHHNFGGGIGVYSPYEAFPYGAYGSRNVIRDCVAHDNADISATDDGEDADGIAVSSGADNLIEHCLVYANSDDGIDTWRSTGTIVRYTIATGSGIANGNGNGFKSGGLAPSEGTLVEHCLSYKNRATGFDYNSGVNVVFRNNTSWDNGRVGYTAGTTTRVESSISSSDASGFVSSSGTKIDNSWQRSGTVSFVSTDPASPDFLRPTPGGGFEDIGAYAP